MRGRQVLVTPVPAALPERRALGEHARLAARQVLLTFGRAPQGRVTLIWR